jgi:hypothetical protein
MTRRNQAKELEMLQRQEQVAKLLLAGVRSHRGIGELVGVSRATVTRDLAAVREMWRARSVEAIEERVAEELAQIDELQAKATVAWLRSCEDEETNHAGVKKGRTTKDGKPLPDEIYLSQTRRGRSGNAAFLEKIAWCIQKRLDLLGKGGTGKVALVKSEAADYSIDDLYELIGQCVNWRPPASANSTAAADPTSPPRNGSPP